jgi:hypothetical protein
MAIDDQAPVDGCFWRFSVTEANLFRSLPELACACAGLLLKGLTTKTPAAGKR